MATIIDSTALEVIADAIVSLGYGAEGTSLFMGMEVDGDIDKAGGLILPDEVVIVTEGDGLPSLTMGLPVALENPVIQVLIRGAVDDYPGAKRKALGIRYGVAALSNFTSRGLTLHTALPLGSILPLGPDVNGRPRFTVKFTATTDPSYTP